MVGQAPVDTKRAPGSSRQHLLRLRRLTGGQGMVEFALILPLLLLLMMGIIEFGYVLIVYSGMFNAAREGARLGVVRPKDQVAIVDLTRDKVFLVDPTGVSINVWYDCGPCPVALDVDGNCVQTCRSGQAHQTTWQFTDTGMVEVGDRVLVHLAYDLPTITPLIQPFAATLHIETDAARTVTLQEVPNRPSGGGFPDADGDGVTDAEDLCPGFDDTVDIDGDGAPGRINPDTGAIEGCDNCVDTANANQQDADGDGIGDVCDIYTVDIAVGGSAQPNVVDEGVPVQFTYVVTNTGNQPLTAVTLEDTFGNTFAVGNLAPGAAAARTATAVVPHTGNYLVIARGTGPGGENRAVSATIYVVVLVPELRLIVDAMPKRVLPGEQVTFYYAVQNTGNSDLTNVTLTDHFGNSMGPVNLAEGSPAVSWSLTRQLYQTTADYVVAIGRDPANREVRDDDVVVVDVVPVLFPIVISEPLMAGSTIVTGTAEVGRSIRIRDVMNAAFPIQTLVVDATGVFVFADLPPLVLGHVMVVEGYGAVDTAVVQADAGLFAPIVIHSPLCHGSSVITGTAEPGQEVTVQVAAIGFQQSQIVAGDGLFSFALPARMPLQAGQSVVVDGYGLTASVTVEGCTTDAYITISPQCGGPGSNFQLVVTGHNWLHHNQNDITTITWDGIVVGTYHPRLDGGTGPEWQRTVTVNTPVGEHTVQATNDLVPLVQATFVSPCPAANLVVSDLRMLTTGVISTYQPLTFQMTVANVGSEPVNRLFWTDLLAIEPITRSVSWTALSSLPAGASLPLTLTIHEGFPTRGVYHVRAFVNSWLQVTESSESDNTYGPVTVDVTREGLPPTSTLTGTAVLVGWTWVSMNGVPVPYARTDVYVCRTACPPAPGGQLVAHVLSNGIGLYRVDRLVAGSYVVVGETWIDGVRYSRTYNGVVVREGDISYLIIIMYPG